MKIRLLHTVPLIIDYWQHWTHEAVIRVAGTGVIIDEERLRKEPETRILTDDPEAVCRILGIRFPDEQVIKEQ